MLKNDPKIKWIVRNLCNIQLKRKENGDFYFTLDSPIVFKDDEMQEEELHKLTARINAIIATYLEDNIDDISSNEITNEFKEKLVEHVLDVLYKTE